MLAVSELTKRDLIELYGIPEEKIVVTPNGVDPAFTPEGSSPNGEPYALFVGALQPRKDARAAIEALALLGDGAPRLVVVGKDQGGRGRSRAGRRAERPRGPRRVPRARARRRSSPRSTAAPPASSSRRATRASACPSSRRWPRGRRWSRRPPGALPEVAGGAAILVEERNPVALAGGIERAMADRERLVAAGLERARQFTWAETARRTLEVYRSLL